MTFERWDVLISPFPYIDRSQTKLRPLVVLSHGAFNGDHAVVVGAMITSANGGSWPSDHAILDLPSAGLRWNCVVRWKIFTLSYDVIDRRIGRLGTADQMAVGAGLSSILLP